MKKYKLIKEYPGSWEKNTIVNIASDNIHVLINGVCSPLNPQEIMDYPEYWEEVIEKDYEILSYKHLGTISKVKRLSDGEIFTIGDNIQYNQEISKCADKGKINKIELSDESNVLITYGNKRYKNCISVLVHMKKPLFTTEDGLEVFDDNYYPIYGVFNIDGISLNTAKGMMMWYNNNDNNPSIFGITPNCKTFSTKEAAEEYILMNKPCLSLNDVASIYPGIRKDHNTASHQAERLKELVKSKL